MGAMSRSFGLGVLVAGAILALATGADAVAPLARRADRALNGALGNLVTMRDGPPGVIAVVQRGARLDVHVAGTGNIVTRQPSLTTDHMRIASVAKAFSGAVALSLVNDGVLSLDDTIGVRLPDLPAAWHGVTLRQLLNHTGGVPDFLASQAAQQAIFASLLDPPPPRQLLDFVKNEPLGPGAGRRYHYSNSDNIIVGLMVEAATHDTYEHQLAQRVTGPLGLPETTLPRGAEMPAPFIHGYDLGDDAIFEDVSEIFAAGWAWASGGIVSTPQDLNRFIRGYVGGALFRADVQAEQRRFIRGGGSEPRGPGMNASGLALFRYTTRCGTVYGHTGNTFGYTQFAAASSDGSRSVTVAINLQRTQETKGRQARAVFRALRQTELLAVCAALARG